MHYTHRVDEVHPENGDEHENGNGDSSNQQQPQQTLQKIIHGQLLRRANFLKDNGKNTSGTFGDNKKIRVHCSKGDGACLPRSISHQLYGNEDKHGTLRSRVVEEMLKNIEDHAYSILDRIIADYADKYYKNVPSECRDNYADIIEHLEIQELSKDCVPSFVGQDLSQDQLDQCKQFIQKVYSNDVYHGF